MKAERGAKLLFILGAVLCVLQVWLPGYYLTGDGPCHVYNAQIVHDLWANKNTAFYEPFYTLVYQPNPNWLATLVIALLLFVVNAIVAEKIFLSLYVLLYVCGFRLLLNKIGSKSTYWALTVFLLVFSLTFAKGFYNFSFSIAFYFWVVWSWLYFLDKKNAGRGLLLFMFVGLIFFTHLLAFGFAAFTCAALLASYSLSDLVTQNRRSYFFKNGFLLALFFAPFIILMSWFTQGRGGLQIHLRHHFYRAVELVQGKFLVCVTHEEVPVVLIAAITLLLLLGIALVRFKSYRHVQPYDGFIVSLVFVAFVYLFFPDSFLGALILIGMRVQLFVFILIICCIAYLVPEGWLKNGTAIVLFGCFTVLSLFRLSCQVKASQAATDYLSVNDHIKPYSVVLPLDFCPNGKDIHGKMIADRNFLFVHTAQYLGTIKPLIVLDNYEANMGYFPIHWKDKTNPYFHLSSGNDSSGGIEGVPPTADIAGYLQKSEVGIDYIVMWCYEPAYLKNESFRKLYNEINEEYHIVYTSPSKRTILYEKNK